MNITNSLYRAARLSADIRAVRKGPAAVGRRVIRKQVYKRTNKTVAGILRILLKG